MSPTREYPRNVQSLNQRIANYAKSHAQIEQRVRLAVAGVIVGQMLPAGVVKGGAAITIRLGLNGSRFSADFDTVRAHSMSPQDYSDLLEEHIGSGWCGFSGTVVPRRPAKPPGVPPHYVMQPFDVKLRYQGASWMTLELELGHDELGSAEASRPAIASTTVALFEELGLDTPKPIDVLSVEHQIAQKLHACTCPDGGAEDRAHDLVDLQLLIDSDPPDMGELRRRATALFAYRNAIAWPPVVRTYPTWPTAYAEAATDLAVIEGVDDAVEWANSLVELICAATG